VHLQNFPIWGLSVLCFSVFTLLQIIFLGLPVDYLILYAIGLFIFLSSRLDLICNVTNWAVSLCYESSINYFVFKFSW